MPKIYTLKMSRLKLIGIMMGIILTIGLTYVLFNGIFTETSYGKVTIKGAGASFPYPLIQSLIDGYQTVAPDISIDYSSVGSGAGQSSIINRLVDFAGSDAPLTDEQLNNAPGLILHIPYTIGAVVLSYNLPDNNYSLNLTASIIAGIYSGKIRYWNDPEIVKYNPALSKLNKSIFVIHRSDASGTTYIFTIFLAKEDRDWRIKYGAGKTISWPNLPTFIGGKGNEGVSNLILQTPYSIGYIEYTYAAESGLPMAAVMNRRGELVKPSIETISLAANIDTSELDPKDLRISNLVIDSDADGAYPIAAPTYFLVYMDWSIYGDNTAYLKAKAFKQWLMWILTEGEKYYEPLGYAPIPNNLKELVFETINLISFDGKPVN